jgi:hypothetical protein
MTDNRQKDPEMNGEYRTSKDTDPSSKEQGICLNCEDRQVCCFPGAGKNVVYCEEHFSDRLDEEKEHRCSIRFGPRPCFGIDDFIPL